MCECVLSYNLMERVYVCLYLYSPVCLILLQRKYFHVFNIKRHKSEKLTDGRSYLCFWRVWIFHHVLDGCTHTVFPWGIKDGVWVVFLSCVRRCLIRGKRWSGLATGFLNWSLQTDRHLGRCPYKIKQRFLWLWTTNFEI